jgi:indole-3-glycerol phosphate synthase
MDKLDEIMAWKREEVAPRMRPVDDHELVAARNGRPSFLQALVKARGLGVIAEIKRRSPSAGDIAPATSALAQARRYLASGADCLSILTDTKFFGGTLEDLSSVTKAFTLEQIPVPALRKDFMVHPIQVLEAAKAGASCILLIVRALDDATMRELDRCASLAGLDALYEVHNEQEIDRSLACGARMIGVNNRDLAIFKTDLGLSERLIPRIPRDVLAVSESGIFTAADARRVEACGARAILVGEALMRAPDPAALLQALKGAPPA